MTHASFVHLRVHTAYSLLEGALPIAELVALCQAMEMPAVAAARPVGARGRVLLERQAIRTAPHAAATEVAEAGTGGLGAAMAGEMTKAQRLAMAKIGGTSLQVRGFLK